MRKITYISGTRADFGLIQSTLLNINSDPELEINVCVTGMHFFEQYGKTIDEIKSSGLDIGAEVKVEMQDKTGAGMSHSIADMIHGLTSALEKLNPDIVIVLGDRGEMLAGAIAAIHLNIPIVHIHGGERSGTIDEPIRHAISKLSHYHFVTTEQSRHRLIKMGENKENVYRVGAPGLDDIFRLPVPDKVNLYNKYQLDETKETILIIYHPVVQDGATAGDEISTILDAVQFKEFQIVILMPNSDAGSYFIRKVIKEKRDETFRIISHMPRNDYLEMVSLVNVLVGNSSSGIIEAATLGTAVVNIGSRQALRERNSNVIDVPVIKREYIQEAMKQALNMDKGKWDNVYGTGDTAIKITDLLKKIPINKSILKKCNSY